MTNITARLLITATGTIEWPEISVDEGGIVTAIHSGKPNTSETTLTPTFFDIHVHGAAGHDVMEATPQALTAIGNFLATKGVANYLATTVTASVDATLRALDGIADAIENHQEHASARPVGIHLEGPFISHAKRGVHPPAAIQPPSIPLFEQMQQAARGHIRLITTAPEIPGALDLIAYATERGTRVSLGHSNANAGETRTAIAAGACSATHTFNAMRPLEPREPGIAGVVLDDSTVFAELICDGIHVSPEFVRLWLRSKGAERAILITDGISATGMPDGPYKLGGFDVVLTSGRCLLTSNLERGKETLAGSVLTMDRAVANVQRFTGASLQTAVQLASRNPAAMLGLDCLNEICEGGPANFNVFSSEGVLVDTLFNGKSLNLTRN